MLFSPQRLLLGATCLIATFTGFTRADDCESGPWQDVSSVGGNGGGRWCATKFKSGIVITGIEAWADKKSVRGVQFYYSDGTNSGLVGKQDGDRHGRMDWDPSVDQISQIKMWGNGVGKYNGRIYIRTKKGNEFDVGKDTSGQDVYETKVASGIMLGAFGNAGERIDHLGFLFLKSKIEKITVGDVVFSETPEELNSKKEGLEVVTVDYADYENGMELNNNTYRWGRTITKEVSKKFTHASTHTFGWSHALELSGKILELGAKSTTTLSYQYAKTDTVEDQFTDKVEVMTQVWIPVPPGGKIYCRAVAMTGKYSGDYSSKVSIWLEDGSTFEFEEEGHMEQINWSKAESKCQDDPFPPEKRSRMRANKFIA
ncbi:hypothetical protein CC78DRAFT_534762 [Lojkania enalia]|uniref:Jacalin-type lectin domain-containing protein n=1 Tax=Lojkania enalia TaxID=147567 RepID=A0A9P4N4U6_9PLEO|nr:hypothetical protein CC78DRAFT_534762 [Didymosphaeria enalia]